MFSRSTSTRRPSIRAPSVRRYSRRYRRRSGMPRAIMRATRAPELKSWDFTDASSRAMVLVASVAGATTMTTGMTVLNVLGSGTGYSERLGNKVSNQSLAVEADFALAQTDASAAVIRVLVIYDRQPNGAFPAIADLLSNNSSATVTFNSAISIPYRDRYAVLRDTQLPLDPGSGLSRHFECYIKRPLQSSFKSTAYTDVRDIGAGALYLVAFYVQLYGTTVPTISNVHSRLRYTDN